MRSAEAYIRPLYTPQDGQAWWLCLSALQLGQVVSGVADVFHCERRVRVFARDIFLLGTATANSLSLRYPRSWW